MMARQRWICAPVPAARARACWGIIIDLDLGARFGVNRFKFFPRNADPDFPAPSFPYQNDFMRAFEIFINDGTPETQREGVPIRETVVLVNQNEDPVVDVHIPPQYVRFVRLKSLTSTGFDLAEFQVFGTGFVPEATYISNVFDFGDLSLFGTLRWVEQKMGDSGLSRVLIRTRTGNDPQPVEYNKIRPGEQIFRLGGGSRQTGTTARGDEVPWKFAADVEDAELKTLVETVLDKRRCRFARGAADIQGSVAGAARADLTDCHRLRPVAQ